MSAVVIFAAQASTVSAQARHALIIGNSAYTHVDPLANTLADAGAYADVFGGLGYDVTLLSDLDRSGLERALADFYDRIAVGDTAVFVFSGHGWSDGTTNYILPTDVRAESSERRVKLMSVPLRNGVNGIVDQIRGAGAAVQVAIIDACRNNIFAGQGTRSLGMRRGLAVERAPQGAFLIFSAGAGEQALDRLPDDGPDQQLSVFTRHFLPRLEAGLYLEDAINDAQMATAQDARKYGGHLQNPAYYDQINGKLCLSGACSGTAPGPAPRPEDTATASASPCSEARQVWQDIRGSNTSRITPPAAPTRRWPKKSWPCCRKTLPACMIRCRSLTWLVTAIRGSSFWGLFRSAPGPRPRIWPAAPWTGGCRRG